MRAVIYARYSSDNQRAASIEDQVRICRDFIDAKGWSLASVYTDAAISGATVLRPGYQKLLEDARKSAFEVVVAEALDRLSRDQEDVAGLYKQLSFAGVKLVTIAEGEINELHVGLKGTMNALYLKDLADKTRRGLRGKVEAGRSAGGLCFGYKVARKNGETGAVENGEREVDTSEALIIRRIFREYADGRSPRASARGLNAEGIPGPAGKAWGASTINGNVRRGTGILNNELYIGRLVWNRLRYVEDPSTGKRVSRPNPGSSLIVRDVPALRIVDQALWDRVKERQGQARRNTRPEMAVRPFWDRRRPRYLFSGLMKCGVCGGGYSKISNNLFGCSTARNKGTCDNRINIRRDVLEASVLNGLKHHLMDPALFKEFADEFYKEINRLRMAEASKADQAKTELAAVERKLRKIVEAISDGVPARTLKDELLRLEARKDELEAQVANAAEPKPLVHPNLAEIYRRKVEDLHRALLSDDTRFEAADIIRSLVDEIVLTPDHTDLRIDLKGELAAILAISADSKKPEALGLGSEQIKMVAGARYQRYLQIAEGWIPRASSGRRRGRTTACFHPGI